jgi:hypothetical protein
MEDDIIMSDGEQLNVGRLMTKWDRGKAEDIAGRRQKIGQEARQNNRKDNSRIVDRMTAEYLTREQQNINQEDNRVLARRTALGRKTAYY